jgi:hypothetical protein
MNSSSKIGTDTAAAKSRDVAEEFFEVEDIAAFDPLPATSTATPKDASKVVAVDDLLPLEIELSADDMDAMLGDDVISVEVS